MKEEEKDKITKEDEEKWIKFKRLLDKAKKEGRLDGKFRCPICGMRYHYEREADDCCRIESPE